MGQTSACHPLQQVSNFEFDNFSGYKAYCSMKNLSSLLPYRSKELESSCGSLKMYVNSILMISYAEILDRRGETMRRYYK